MECNSRQGLVQEKRGILDAEEKNSCEDLMEYNRGWEGGVVRYNWGVSEN